MASIEKRTDRGQEQYLVRWRDVHGSQRKKTFLRGQYAEARAFKATLEADRVRGISIEHHNRITVAAYARDWAATRPHRPTTARRTAGLIDNHIAATKLGSRRLADVRPSEVQAWATDRAKALAPSTLRSLVVLLRSIFAAAVRDRLVGASPVIRIQLPRADRERVVPLTVEQVQALAGAMPHRYRTMIIVQAGLGLRIGELLALRAEDVDFLRRTARVEWQFTSGSGSKFRTEPKSPRSRRTIPAPQVVLDALAAHWAIHTPGEDGSVFTTAMGTPLGHTYYGQLIGRAVAAAGLPAGTTSHDLRHHYASVLLAAGESVIAVAERLGHEDAALVLSTYGHLMPDSEDRTRRAVDAAWGTADVPCAPDVPQVRRSSG
ncbi:tyrosine-type recombinase/integrase [Geodermatophilus sp. SYSU D00684]